MTRMSGSMCSMTPPLSPRLHDAELQDVDMLDDFDSPPLNLIMFQDLEEDVEPVQTKTAACFQCQGDVFPRRGSPLYQHIKFHDKGILKSGVLDRVLSPAPASSAAPDLPVQLFGYCFPYMALRDRMEKLFRFARQTMSEIQDSSDQDGCPTLNKRQDLVGFLEYVNTFVHRCLPEDEDERRRFLRSLLRQLQLLLVHAGRISEEVSVTRYTLDQLGSVHHNFHHRLELTWYLLAIFHTLTTASCASDIPLDVKLCQSPTGDDEVRSAFDQLVSVLFCDLITLAVPVFEKMSPHEWLHTSPFSCACVMEMWVLVTHLLRHRKEKYDTESFWVQLHRILQTVGNTCTTETTEVEEELDSDVLVLTISPQPGRPQGYCLWLTTHLAHLFTFHHHGNHSTPDPTQNCFFAMQMTMEKILRSPIKEEMLRACLRCCLSVASLWPPPNQLLTLLWEHFSRKLNDRFQLHATSIEGLAVISKSSTSLLERCKKWCNGDDSGLDHETSFHLFLRLLARLLGHSGAIAEWRQIKGRFFSKFHQRRMQELGEMGLHNMTCLFLTVAMCVDAEEVARKLLALYDMVDPMSAYGRLRTQVWCGALAATQLLVKLQKNFAFLAEKLVSSFNSLAKQLSGSAMDYGQKQELSPLITLYVDGLRDIVEQSQLEGAEHLLIDEGIDMMLHHCSDSQMRHILTALDSVVMRLRCLVSEQKQVQPCLKENHAPSHMAFAERLWLHVFPFVCDHAVTLTPPLSLADLAVSFTHLALDFPAPLGVCPGGIPGVARRFVLSDSIHTSIACHYLNQVLGDQLLSQTAVSIPHATTGSLLSSSSSSSSSATAGAASVTTSPSLKASVPLSQTDIVKCWWRCVILMAPSSSTIVELTQHVMSLPDVQWLMSGRGGSVDGDVLSSIGWKQLLKAIGSRFHSSQGLLDKQKVRDQVMPYFADTAHQVAPVMRALGPLDTLLHVYRVLGYLIKHCAPLLYLQSKTCPLPEITKSLVLPAAVFNTDRALSANFLAAIRDTLHLFLEGLGRLDYHRDLYVQRQVRSIVTQFLPRFPLSHVDVYSHPVLRLLGRLPHQTTFTDADFHRFVVDVVAECLQRNSSSVGTEVIAALKARLRC